MIDKILILKNLILITYYDRTPILLTTDGDPKVFLEWFMKPSVLTLDEYSKAVVHLSEDTVITEAA